MPPLCKHADLAVRLGVQCARNMEGGERSLSTRCVPASSAISADQKTASGNVDRPCSDERQVAANRENKRRDWTQSRRGVGRRKAKQDRR